MIQVYVYATNLLAVNVSVVSQGLCMGCNLHYLSVINPFSVGTPGVQRL